MHSRTALRAAAAAGAAALVGSLTWLATRQETRHRARLVRNSVLGWPVVAFTRVHGTIDLTGGRRPLVHDCDLTGNPHPSRAAIFLGDTTTHGRLTNLRITSGGAGVATDAPAGPDRDPDAGDAADQGATPAPWEASVSAAATLLWENRPPFVREMPHDDQVRWVSGLIKGAYNAADALRAALTGDGPAAAAEQLPPRLYRNGEPTPVPVRIVETGEVVTDLPAGVDFVVADWSFGDYAMQGYLNGQWIYHPLPGMVGPYKALRFTPPATEPAADDQDEAAWGPLRESVALLWEVRPDEVRQMSHDEQVKLITDLVIGAYTTLWGGLRQQADEQQAPTDAAPADGAVDPRTDGTPEV